MNNIKKILAKYDKPGPRYTSYPPATYFSSEFDENIYKKNLIESNTSAPAGISLYIHIPFCNEKCFFCGCNMTRKMGLTFEERYVNALLTEMDTITSFLDKNREVIQIHWGGGTPNALPFELIEKIMNAIRSKFTIGDNCEVAIECNPADLDDDKIVKLVDYGFNRVSLGIQDLRDDVLKLVNRRPSAMPVDQLVKKLKAAGIDSVNIDLIYGLPLQTVESFGETIEEIIKISPDRLVTFSYAHVPWVMKAQKALEKAGLPTADEKMAMLLSSQEKLIDSGYVAIGMDHYAKNTDLLNKALDEKKLHRNFQGYCTKETTGQVYALGCSGISQLTTAYSKNKKDPQKYIDRIEATGLAVIRGYELSVDEQICRTVINEIMCNLYLDFVDVANQYNTSIDYIKNIVEFNLSKLQEFIEDKLLTIDGEEIQISKEGSFIVRNIAMCFDPKRETDTAQYSRTV